MACHYRDWCGLKLSRDCARSVALVGVGDLDGAEPIQRAIDEENLHRDVGLDVCLAEEREDLAAGQLFDLLLAARSSTRARGDKNSRTERHTRKGAVYIARRVRYVRAHSDPTCVATGCAWRCTSGIGTSTRSHVGCDDSGPLHLYFWTKESVVVHRSGIASGALGGACETSRGRETARKRVRPGRSDAVLSMIVGDLARTWTKRRRARGPSLRSGVAPQRTSEVSRWKP